MQKKNLPVYLQENLFRSFKTSTPNHFEVDSEENSLNSEKKMLFEDITDFIRNKIDEKIVDPCKIKYINKIYFNLHNTDENKFLDNYKQNILSVFNECSDEINLGYEHSFQIWVEKSFINNAQSLIKQSKIPSHSYEKVIVCSTDTLRNNISHYYECNILDKKTFSACEYLLTVIDSEPNPWVRSDILRLLCLLSKFREIAPDENNIRQFTPETSIYTDIGIRKFCKKIKKHEFRIPIGLNWYDEVSILSITENLDPQLTTQNTKRDLNLNRLIATIELVANQHYQLTNCKQHCDLLDDFDRDIRDLLIFHEYHEKLRSYYPQYSGGRDTIIEKSNEIFCKIIKSPAKNLFIAHSKISSQIRYGLGDKIEECVFILHLIQKVIHSSKNHHTLKDASDAIKKLSILDKLKINIEDKKNKSKKDKYFLRNEWKYKKFLLGKHGDFLVGYNDLLVYEKITSVFNHLSSINLVGPNGFFGSKPKIKNSGIWNLQPSKIPEPSIVQIEVQGELQRFLYAGGFCNDKDEVLLSFVQMNTNISEAEAFLRSYNAYKPEEVRKIFNFFNSYI